MEDLVNLFKEVEIFKQQLIEDKKEFMKKFYMELLGTSPPRQEQNETNVLAEIQNTVNTPVQTKKRVKRLSSLIEDDDVENDHPISEKTKPLPMEEGTPIKITTALDHNDILIDENMASPQPQPAPRNNKMNANENIENVKPSERESVLMPPPPPPAALGLQEQTSGRPQRAAKVKCEKNLKEPGLGGKLRRPDEPKVKLEHEQRPSQINMGTKKTSKDSIESWKSDDSVLVLPGKPSSVIELSSDEESMISIKSSESEKATENLRQLRIKVKREKKSTVIHEGETSLASDTSSVATIKPVPAPIQIKSERLLETSSNATLASSNASLISSNASTITANAAGKKGKKKKEAHRPIKVERFSEIDEMSPISTRSRKKKSQEAEPEPDLETETEVETQDPKQRSIYEDAIEGSFETPPSNIKTTNKVIDSSGKGAENTFSVNIVNETMTIANGTMILGGAPNATMTLAAADATFKLTPNPNATITLANKQLEAAGDATFNIQNNDANNDDRNDSSSTKHSMETARDTTQPQNESLLTEDESFEKTPVVSKVTASAKAVVPTPASAIIRSKITPGTVKAMPKLATHKNELFNPLVQSPVKMRVEAFEHAAQVASDHNKKMRPKKAKENATGVTTTPSFTTPQLGRIQSQPGGRFLTPTQTSNITQSAVAAKKGPNSASKAMAFPKIATAITAPKTLTRENSGDDFRKNLHQMAEERKKQREQKHLHAAQQREAKERERAERLAKLAKEREEKRLKKKELDEIQRKLRQQEEAAAAEAAKIKAAKEREMQMQMKQQQQAFKQMMPPPPKVTGSSKYTFEMLHEDDSTDDEDKTSYKRPPPPFWSRREARGEGVLKQQYCPSSVIDSFFSVQPTTPDLKIIFPNIDARHLKRNSSVLWSTPPRYSELPKY